ncbi:MAG: hypothetical protein FDZ70_01095 [Actinobacteria bacterium]|nr:MAG: hypothetical protein FDZ70_01095 [Actinomycetota bacterium]
MSDTWGKADLHMHSNHSDGLATIPEIMDWVERRTDLDVIAITDHNTIEGALFAKSLEDLHRFEVVVGEEVSTRAGHVIGLWLTEHIPAGMSVAETLAAIDEQGGVAVIPHPFSPLGIFGPFGRSEFVEALNDAAFHALEVYNSVPYLVFANSIAAKMFTGGQGIAATGGSDSHVLQAIGKGHTLFRGRTAEELRRSIENLETRASAHRQGLNVALRYTFSIPRIRRQQSWNWERCQAR